MSRQGLRIVTAFVLIAAAFAAVPVADGQAQAAVGTTSLTLIVHGCDGCTIQPVRAGNGTTVHLWRGTPKKVRNGVAHWKVTIRHTVGMSFDIRDPHAVNVGAIPDIVVAYRGLATGDPVPRGVAKHKKLANGCWAGTDKASVTLRIRVERFRTTSAYPPPVRGYSIRPYFTTTQAFLPIAPGVTYTSTFHGAIGNQDAYYCGLVDSAG